MKRTRIVRIVKRDGSKEPFDIGKVRRCLLRAMVAAGEQVRFADNLARAVALHLRDWDEPARPSSTYVFHCVRSVLRETGMVAAARCLEQHHRSREARRRAVGVRRPGSETSRGWCKAAVAITLQRRHGLRRATARILAGQIEQRVLDLGYRTVSTSLIVELVRSELQSWGLSEPNAAPSGQTAVSRRATRPRRRG